MEKGMTMTNNASRIALLGGDTRQIFTARKLIEDGYSVSAWGLGDLKAQGLDSVACTDWRDAVMDAEILLLPLPVSADGVRLNCPLQRPEESVRLSLLPTLFGGKLLLGGKIPPALCSLAEEKGIACIDYFDSELLQLKNALPTVEGALFVAMGELSVPLDGAEIAVIGYGRIGSLLGKRLTALGARVYAVTRSPEKLAAAFCDGCIPFGTERLSECISISDAVFNTAPATVLDKERLPYISKGCPVIDLASAPGGVDTEEAKRLGIKVIWALSLPGKYSPKTAASIIADAVREHFDRTRNR